MSDITELLRAAAEGDNASRAALLDAVYAELHQLARSHMRRERPDHTLQPTALVNEAYLHLIGNRPVSWENRAHFFVAASRTMRRILVDHARLHRAAKRSGNLRRVDFDAGSFAVEEQAEELIALDDALDRLGAMDARHVQVVELRFFTGLSVEETAKVLDVSETTVKRDWALARAWLEEQLPSMSPSRWERIRAIFGGALDLPPEERIPYVEEACGEDAELAREILKLLERHETPAAYVDQPPAEAAAARRAISGRTFEPGDLVSGRLRVERFLGEGGMGEVYAALDTELNVPVALKTLRVELAASTRFADRFRREIQIARQITHPNVCRVFDAGRDGGSVYFTMELLEGETLAQRIERSGRISRPEALPIIRQLCGGLTAAHQCGVVHRDFKSANVMFSGERAVITDFGLARLLDPTDSSTSTTGIAIGTPAYMSPEQIEGNVAGPPADIYALGVVMYEMLTGERPYTGASPLALAARKLKYPPRPPHELADVPPDWEQVILRCLAAEPGDRFASAAEVIEALEGGKLVRVSKRLPARLASTAVGIVLLAGVGGLALKWRSAEHVPSAETLRWYQQGAQAFAENANQKAAGLLEHAIALDDQFLPAHGRLAEVYTELDMLDKAKDQIIHLSSLQPNRSQLPPDEAQLLDAARFMVERDFEKAASAYQAIADRPKPEPAQSQSLLDAGRANEKANLTPKAVASYRKAAAAGTFTEAAQLHLGILAMRGGESDKALQLLGEAERMFRLKSNFEGVTAVLIERAHVYENTKRLSEAEGQLNAAIEMTRLTGNPEQQIRSRLELSRVDVKAGAIDRAKGLAEEALRLAEEKKLENLSVSGLNSVGDAFGALAKWKDAEAYYTRALEVSRRSRARQGEARALLLSGQAKMYLGDLDSASPLIDEALRFYRTGNYWQQEQACLAVLTDLQLMQGRYREAQTNSEQLEKLATQHHQTPVLLWALGRTADRLMLEGDYPRTLEVRRREAEEAAKAGQQADVANSLINQADALWRMGRYEEYSRTVEQARTVMAKLGKNASGPEGRLLLVEAAALLSRGRARESLVKAQSAEVSFKDSPSRLLQVRSLRCLSEALNGQVEAGRRLCEETVRKAEDNKVPDRIVSARLALAEAAQLAHDPSASQAAEEARRACVRWNRKEPALRALWVLSRVRALSVAEQAAEAEESRALQALWGAEIWKSYLARPDLQSLRRRK